MNESPMVREVDKIVSNLLIAEGAVCIPAVGSLRVVRRGAKRISSRRVEPPCLIVEFTSQPVGTSLADAIACAAGCGSKQAVEICGRWLAYVRKEEALAIGGVGVLRDKSFAIDPAFDRLLNPQGHDAVTLRSGRGGHWFLWTVASIAILCGLGVCGWILYDQLGSSAIFPAQAGGRSAASAEAGIVLPTSDSQTEALSESGSIETSAARSADSEAVNGSNPASPHSDTGVSVEHRVDVTHSDSKGSAASQGGESSAVRAESPTDSDPMEASRLVSGHTYVVLGVFSSLENARRALREVGRREPAIHCRIYLYGPKYMVSMFSSESSEAGRAFVHAYSDRFPDMWTYRAK